MVEHALDRGHDVVAVCREKSVGKLAEFDGPDHDRARRDRRPRRHRARGRGL